MQQGDSHWYRFLEILTFFNEWKMQEQLKRVPVGLLYLLFPVNLIQSKAESIPEFFLQNS